MSAIDKYISFLIEEWGGLPHVVGKALDGTFRGYGPVVVNKLSDEEYLQSPMFNQVLAILRAIDDAGGKSAAEAKLKMTAGGNLPVKLVKELYSLGAREVFHEGYEHKVYKESDSITVQIAHFIAELGGLVKKQQNHLTLTVKGKKCLSDYPLLMETILNSYGWDINLAYFDGWENEFIGQYQFGISIFLLAIYGDEERKTTFYSERYAVHNNFIDEVDGDDGFGDSVESFHRCYEVRTFERFLNFLGLVEYKVIKRRGEKRYALVSKTALFDKLITLKKEKVG